MPSLLNDPAHWHLRAQEARLLASQLDDPVAKAATLKIAQEYERLAARAANREMVKHPSLLPPISRRTLHRAHSVALALPKQLWQPREVERHPD
jgi:hypothetical protein